MNLPMDNLLSNFSAVADVAYTPHKGAGYATIKASKKGQYLKYTTAADMGESYDFTFFARKVSGKPSVTITTTGAVKVENRVRILSSDFKKYKLRLTVPIHAAADTCFEILLGGVDTAGTVEVFKPVLEIENTMKGGPQTLAMGLVGFSINGPLDTASSTLRDSSPNFGIKSLEEKFSTIVGSRQTVSVLVELDTKLESGKVPHVQLSSYGYSSQSTNIIPFLWSVDSSEDNEKTILQIGFRSYDGGLINGDQRSYSQFFIHVQDI